MPLDASHDKRLAALRGAMTSESISHVWLEPSYDLFYLTGIETLSFERFTGLLVAQDTLRVVTPLMLAHDFAALEDVAEIATWQDSEGPGRTIGQTLRDVSQLRVLRSLPMWSLEEMKRARPGIGIGLEPGILSRLREVKDDAEIDALRRSAAVTDEIVGWIENLKLDGTTERLLWGRIQARYLELGHKPGECLVASGANAAMAHYAGGDVTIDLTQPLLTDFGAPIDGYWSDTTRVFFPDRVDAEVERAYEAVCAAHDAALAASRPGARSHDVDRAARAVIEEAGLGERFVHRTGHGVGLEIHEGPYIRSGDDQELRAGNIFTIEPGVYVPGRFGLRYENVVVVTDGGAEPLNATPRRHLI